MLRIKNLISDINVVQAIFTAETESDVRTMIELLDCYASDCFHRLIDLSEIEIPVNKEVILTLKDIDGTISLNLSVQ